MSDLVFTYEPEKEGPRQTYRAKVPGLVARIPATGAVYSVPDISVGGISLDDPDGTLKMGDVVALDVCIKHIVIIKEIRAEVARRHEVIAGLRFTGLEPRQEQRLDKFVLEVQKHDISKKKSGGSQVDEESGT